MSRALLVALTTFALASLSPTGVHGQPPSYLITTAGQPVVAVFQDRGESYALGCVELLARWNLVELRHVKTEEWGPTLAKTPIAAHVHCDNRVTPFLMKTEPSQPPQPGGLLIPHTDDKLYRHYVDHWGWHSAIRGAAVKSLTPQELESLDRGRRGPDFVSKFAPPPEPNQCRFTACIGVVEVCCGSGGIKGFCIGVSSCPGGQ